MSSVEKRGRGRPAGRTQPIQLKLRVNEEFLAKLDRWRDRQPEPVSRTEAIRQAVDLLIKVKAGR